jgi:MFS family permease
VGPSTAYLLEAAPPARRAYFASWQIASQGLATLTAGLIGLFLSLTLSKEALSDWGWRVPFFLGILIVPIGMVIRAALPETAGEGADPAAAPSLAGVLRLLFAEHGGRLALTLLVIMAATISFYIGANMPTYAEATLKLSPQTSSIVTLSLGTASIIFTLYGGWLADRIGRRPVMIVPRAAIVIVAIPAFWLIVHYPAPMSVYAVTILLSALSSISTAAVIVAVPEALPRNVRSSGLSIVYALSVSLFGGSAPWLVTKLIAVTHDRVAPAYYLAATSLIGAIAAYFLPETQGRSLD